MTDSASDDLVAERFSRRITRPAGAPTYKEPMIIVGIEACPDGTWRPFEPYQLLPDGTIKPNGAEMIDAPYWQRRLLDTAIIVGVVGSVLVTVLLAIFALVRL